MGTPSIYHKKIKIKRINKIRGRNFKDGNPFYNCLSNSKQLCTILVKRFKIKERFFFPTGHQPQLLVATVAQ